MLPFKRHLLSMGAHLFIGPPYFSSLALSYMSLCGWDVLKLGLSLKPKDYRKLVCEWPQVWGKKVARGRVGLPSFAAWLAVGVLWTGKPPSLVLAQEQWADSSTHASIILTCIMDSIHLIFSVNLSNIVKWYNNILKSFLNTKGHGREYIQKIRIPNSTSDTK